MPSSYSGNAAGLAVTDPVTISNPNDGEAGTAASNDVATKKLADYAKFILGAAGFLGVARTWTAIQTFTESIKARGPSEYVAALLVDVLPATKKLILQAGTGSSHKLRVYYDAGGQLYVTINAAWNGSSWDQDAVGAHHQLIIDASGGMYLRSVASGTANWADGSWATLAGNGLHLQEVVAGGNITANAQLAGDTLAVGTDANVGDDLVVGGDLGVAGPALLGNTLGVTGRISGPDLALSSNPSASTALQNILSAAAIPKVWASILITAGNGGNFTCSLQDGLNTTPITPVTRQSSTVFRLGFAQALANANFCIMPWATNTGAGQSAHLMLAGRNTGFVDLSIAAGNALSALDLDAAAAGNAWTVTVGVFARQ